MNHGPLRTLAVLCTLAVATPALGRPVVRVDEEVTPPRAGFGGDAVLPAGFKEVRWGASTEILMATRGPLERRPSADPDTTILIESPAPGDPRADIIHYTLWRDQLIELRIYYQDRLVGADAHQFVDRVEDAYGVGEHIANRRSGTGGTFEILEESWQWEDPFTVQVLLRDPKQNEWSMLRRSKVLEERRARTLARERETDADHRVNQIPID